MKPVRTFQIVYALLTLNFVVPALSYVVAPGLALDTLDRVNRMLGGGPYPFVESGQVWHMLAVGNVMTLGAMCALLLVDLRRFYPVLPALAFLKAFSALYAAWIGATLHAPAFLGIALLDGTTTVAMVFFAVRAHRALPPRSPIDETLARIDAARVVPRTPTRAQIDRGILRMLHRLVFRPGTIGTCKTGSVRRTWRARLLQWRVLRLPFLVRERAIAPFDLSGLASPPDRIIRHLLAAHHDGVQFAYDLELLALHPGRLEELRGEVKKVIDGDDARARWLRDLTVFEGYHEALLDAVERTLRGERLLTPEQAADPDLSLHAYLSWCASA
jgi:hypothetical protein